MKQTLIILDNIYVLHSSQNFIQLLTCGIPVILYIKFTSIVENSVDPDQLASEKPADQGLHCYSK